MATFNGRHSGPSVQRATANVAHYVTLRDGGSESRCLSQHDIVATMRYGRRGDQHSRFPCGAVASVCVLLVFSACGDDTSGGANPDDASNGADASVRADGSSTPDGSSADSAGTPRSDSGLAPGLDAATSDSGSNSLTGNYAPFATTVWPVSTPRVASGFGPREHRGRFDLHRGIDFRGATGEPIFAIADGEVVRLAFDNVPDDSFDNLGNVIIVEHEAERSLVGAFAPSEVRVEDERRYYSLYGHLDRIDVVDGQRVTRGEVIGTLGASGTATTEHLHFEIRVFDRNSSAVPKPHVNPLLLLPYEYLNNLALRLNDTDPVSLTVISRANQLDFNRVLVETSARRYELDLNRRVGIDPADRDNPEPPGTLMRYSAPDFSVGSETYELTVTLLDLAAWPGATVTAIDLWGGGQRRTR